MKTTSGICNEMVWLWLFKKPTINIRIGPHEPSYIVHYSMLNAVNFLSKGKVIGFENEDYSGSVFGM